MHETIIPGTHDPRPRSVEAYFVDWVCRHVDRADLRDRSDVPELDHAVGVAGRDDVAPGVARHPIARVGMSIKRLHAQSASRIPDADRLVAAGGADVIGKRLPGAGID